MALHGARRRLCASRFDDGDGLARRTSERSGPREPRSILDALDVEPKSADSLIVCQELDQVLHGKRRLIAHGKDVPDRHGSLVEHQSQCDGATLTNQCDATGDRHTDDLIGPQRDAIEEIDEAVAVWAEEGQRSCALYELVGEPVAFYSSGFGEAGCKTDKAAT